MEPIQSVKGMNDILPSEIFLWRRVEDVAREIFHRFGYREIRTPIVEKSELFSRGIGEATDIVEKEMYTFSDSKGRMLTLRPEATASIIRAFIQHQLYASPVERKFFLIGPMFRHERPQKGRYRQFHQIDVEVLGINNPMVDAEVMYLACLYLEEIGLRDVSLEINTLGCAACRPIFRKILQEHLLKYLDSLCPDCARRVNKNPLRCFDCKVPSCNDIMADAPIILDFVCEQCLKHFDTVKYYLSELGISYSLNPRLVRGLDYYVSTAFEIVTEHLGAQNAVGGGGRYDGLIKELGGPDLPGIGFALGMERIILLLEKSEDFFQDHPFLYCIFVGDRARQYGFKLVQNLRREEFSVECDYENRSLKSQMRTAHRFGVPYALIIGDEELDKGIAHVRDMRRSEQFMIKLNDIVQELRMLVDIDGGRQS